MILFLDISTLVARAAVISSKGATWSKGSSGHALVEKVARSAKKIDAIVIARPALDGTLKATWSGIRTSVAVGNALAFTSGAKLSEIEISGREKPAELVAAARAAVKKTKKATWLEPRYSGEPNITTPKPR